MITTYAISCISGVFPFDNLILSEIRNNTIKWDLTLKKRIKKGPLCPTTIVANTKVPILAP